MSRIHSGHKGRAGSHRPYPLTKPEWVTTTQEELVAQAVQLSKSGLSSAQVGLHLRDSDGIPSARRHAQQLLGWWWPARAS